MPISQLDPAAALVLIDLQKGVIGLPTAHSSAAIVADAARLARAFRRRNLPVVLVNVVARAPGRTSKSLSFTPPPDWHELSPELGAEPQDIRVTKYNVGAFHGTSLDLQLRRRGVTQIFLGGIATSSGVEATARAGYDHGYNIVAVTDAMTDMDAESHDHAVRKQFPKIGETTTVAEVLSFLGG